MLGPNDKILFTRQLHEAEKAGRHYDIRFVKGDKAYSFATKKDLPGPGKSIVLFEQPVHTASYALSKEVRIPKGEYGAGVTTLINADKATVGPNADSNKMVISTKQGRFLLKRLDNEKYGKNSWLFRNLEKSAEELKPHQQDALKKLEAEGGVIVNHSTGSGKTKTFLTAVSRAHAEDKTNPALIITPASLVSNVDKEIRKHGLKIDPTRLNVLSYEKATQDYDNLIKSNYSIIVFDEAHKLRNPESLRTQKLTDLARHADRKVAATATATYNHLSDLSPLVNLVSGRPLLPESRKEMENRYLKKVLVKPGVFARLAGAPEEERLELKNTENLKRVLNKYVSYYDSSEDSTSTSDFPEVRESTIEVEMSPRQEEMYKYVEGKLPLHLKVKVRNNIPMDKREKASLNVFSTAVRQASNSVRHLSTKTGEKEFTPKIETAASNLKNRLDSDSNFRGVVYSNYIDAGLKEYSKKLDTLGVKHTLYTGGVSKAEKDQAVADYNSGKCPVLLVSSSGSEGLDLKGTKLVQVLEPHFNNSKIKQVIGRGARYQSHAHLPEDQRVVNVEHYRSTLSKPSFGKVPFSIDKYLSENSEDKDAVFEQVRDLLRK